MWRTPRNHTKPDSVRLISLLPLPLPSAHPPLRKNYTEGARSLDSEIGDERAQSLFLLLSFMTLFSRGILGNGRSA